MRSRNPEQLLDKVITIALIGVLLLILISSLLPLEFAGYWSGIKAVLQEGKRGMALSDLKPDFATVAERLLVFAPFGFLIHQKLIQFRQPYAEAISVSLVVLVALGIEVLQAVFSARHSRMLDFLLATASGIIGIKFSIPLYQIFIQPLFNTAYRFLPGLLWLGNYLLICICMAVIIPASAKISEWDCSYPLLIGNELTHDRPWQGKIRGVAIYPRELTHGEIQKLSYMSMAQENAIHREALGAIALYSFKTTSNNRVLIFNKKGPPLELVGRMPELGARRSGENALHVHKLLFVKSTAPAHALCNAIMDSQAFTLEVEISSDDSRQVGPARIISNSVDQTFRNFMLGEQKGDLVLRVRTPQNGSNGNNLPLETRNDLLTGGWKHVIASYADGVARLFVDGEEATPSLHYDDVLFLGTTLSFPTAFATTLLLLLMGVIARMVFRFYSPFRAAILSLCSVSFVPIGISLLIAIWLKRYPSPIFMGAMLLIPVLGFIVCRKLQVIGSKSLVRIL
jgi:hypothetical protein